MTQLTIYDRLVQAKRQGNKLFAVLIDPDKVKLTGFNRVIQTAIEAQVDFFFIGGSLIVNDMLDRCIRAIKEACDIPVILFPGNTYQLSHRADGILFLSLISGRNPDLLIGNQVLAAPFLKQSSLEILSTGYMLIDGGVPTTVSYISNTQPIPANKTDIALCTAMAGEMLGMQLLYMDAGSGAKVPVSDEMIQSVREATSIPLIVGGGIKDPATAVRLATAGADIIVVGNAIESDPELVYDISTSLHKMKQVTI